jgi:hypothetical protein
LENPAEDEVRDVLLLENIINTFRNDRVDNDEDMEDTEDVEPHIITCTDVKDTVKVMQLLVLQTGGAEEETVWVEML